MSAYTQEAKFPPYELIQISLAPLNLPLSISELHGLLCGYICAGSKSQAEAYLRTLMASFKQLDAKDASALLFTCFSISQHLIEAFDFSFQLLIPDEDTSLDERARAFSDWCEGFTQGLTLSDVGFDHFHDQEAQHALGHIEEFAQLDHDSLVMDENDEYALLEIQEYTRLAVLRLYGDLHCHVSQEQEAVH